jgi:hypothetical protein
MLKFMLPMVKNRKLSKNDENWKKWKKVPKSENYRFFVIFEKFIDFGHFWTPIAVYRFIEISFPQKAL